MTKHELFLKAVEHTLEFEGGYVNDPADPGGETKYGISKRAFPYLDIKNLTKARAIEIYEEKYWKGSIAELLNEEYNTDLAVKVFDMQVHLGRNGARKIIVAVLEDNTVEDVIVESLSDKDISDLLLEMGHDRALVAIRLKLVNHYKERVKKDPKMKKYIKGWLRRANS